MAFIIVGLQGLSGPRAYVFSDIRSSTKSRKNKSHQEVASLRWSVVMPVSIMEWVSITSPSEVTEARVSGKRLFQLLAHSMLAVQGK